MIPKMAQRKLKLRYGTHLSLMSFLRRLTSSQPQISHNTTTTHQIPIRVAMMSRGDLATRIHNTQESSGISASSRPSPLSAMTTPSEESRPTVPGSPTQPSPVAAAVPNETTMVQNQVNGVSRLAQAATAATAAMHSIESSRFGTTSNHAIDILGLLRGWRAAFINLDAGLLAEAGLRVTQPGASANQCIRVEQVRSTSPLRS